MEETNENDVVSNTEDDIENDEEELLDAKNNDVNASTSVQVNQPF